MKQKLKILILMMFFLFPAVETRAQNYWGDGHKQPINDNTENQTDNSSKYKINQLPDIPEEKLYIPQEKNNNPKEKTVAVNPINVPVFELETKTRKIPIGSKLKLAMNSSLNAKISKEGDPFSALIQQDVVIDNNILIPAGTIIRGRVGKVKKPGIFSKSGTIMLNFDHIVTPLGKQIMLDADLSRENRINNKGEIIASQGFKQEIKDNAKEGVDIMKSVTSTAYNVGMDAGKVPVVVTAPAGALVGSLAGTTVFATKSAISIFKKGGNPVIMPGDTLEINFSEELDVPVN